jgi:hypothetical protein
MRLVACEVHYMPDATMRLVVCLTACLMLVLTNAAQAQAPSDPQGVESQRRLLSLYG